MMIQSFDKTYLNEMLFPLLLLVVELVLVVFMTMTPWRLGVCPHHRTPHVVLINVL